MTGAYVDTSCVLAVLFEEKGWQEMLSTMLQFEHLYSANLLEAEVHAALKREGWQRGGPDLGFISWVLPDRPITKEIGKVLGERYLRGADLWHLSVALFLSPEPSALTFLTLDDRQTGVAKAIGFRLEPR